jgi:hypothetical protein
MTHVPITHTKCGGIAFVYDHEPQQGEIMQAKFVVSGKAEPFTRIVCQNCGEHVNMPELRKPVDESNLPAPPQRSGLEPLPPGYYPKGD